jgi:hypothetical protein
VAKYLRFNVQNKEGKLVGLPVQYFIGEFRYSVHLLNYSSGIKYMYQSDLAYKSC